MKNRLSFRRQDLPLERVSGKSNPSKQVEISGRTEGVESCRQRRSKR